MSDRNKNGKELESLFARLEDLKARAGRGDIAISAFLSPRELKYANELLCRSGAAFFCFGGYDEAERKRVYILPEYIDNVKSAWELCELEYDIEICALDIKGSGFERLSHRDIMGSLLGLGIERSVVGDIVTLNDAEAVTFCDNAIASFLCEYWQKAGRDKIKVSLRRLSRDFVSCRKYAPISDTVASPRLDSVVASLCSCSREKAKEMVLSSLVELDYETDERPDTEVKNGNLVSVRGYGKFRIISLDGLTKKGRCRLVGEKFL